MQSSTNNELFEIIENGTLPEIMKRLERYPGIDIETYNSYGETPLIKACSLGRIDLVKFFLTKGSDVNAQSSNSVLIFNTVEVGGKTALISAAQGNWIEIAILLLSSGANVNTLDKNKRTALMWASLKGYAEIVKMLIENKADVNICDFRNETALIYAIQNGHVDTAEVLLKAGSDKNVTNSLGYNIVKTAIHFHHENTALIELTKKYYNS